MWTCSQFYKNTKNAQIYIFIFSAYILINIILYITYSKNTHCVLTGQQFYKCSLYSDFFYNDISKTTITF